jgi:hypothetical protein
MGVVYAPTQHQLLCGDGFFRGGYQPPLLDPMGYPIKVHWRISFAIDTVNGRSRLVKDCDSTTHTHELVKPFLGKSLEIVVWPPSKPALGFPLPDRAFWPLCPRPEVFPSPELRPRPTRFCFGHHVDVRFAHLNKREKWLTVCREPADG